MKKTFFAILIFLVVIIAAAFWYQPWKETGKEQEAELCYKADYKINELKDLIRYQKYLEIDEEDTADYTAALAEMEKTSSCGKRIKISDAVKLKTKQKKVAKANAKKEEWTKKIKDTGKDIGDFVINGVQFHIPRQYIWFGMNEKDGVTDAMNILFLYPEMSTMSAADGQKVIGDINLLIQQGHVWKNQCIEYEGKQLCNDTAKMGFRNALRTSGSIIPILKCPDVRVAVTGECVFNGQPEYNKELNMNALKDIYYYRSKPELPEAWLSCNTEQSAVRPSCETYVMINDKIMAHYSFNRKLIAEHDKIREKVIEKLRSFIDKEDLGE